MQRRSKFDALHSPGESRRCRMANSSKFVSVNLNKSYGQPPTGAFGHGRTRAGAGAASGGTGMVVLSRPRSSGSAGQKGTPKLSVPPPLNLPSRRKEHEGLDPSSATGSSARPGSSGVGSGAGSSTMGWTKPAVLLERDGPLPLRSPDPRGGSAYMPPSARSSGQPPTVEKAVLLRGEDFPSLGAATVTSMPKQKDLKQKPRGEDSVHGRLERTDLATPLDMRPQMRSAHSNVNEKNASPVTPEKPQKQDGYFPGPLPLVRLSHKSDWADDERDTGLSIPERDRGFSDGGGGASAEFFRGDSFRRDNVNPGRDARDAGSWRAPQLRDGATAGASRDNGKEGNYNHLARSENGYGYGYGAGRDIGSRSSTQNGRNAAETAYNGRTDDQRGRYGDFSNNWSRGDTFQNSKIAKNTFSSGSKGFSLNDPILNFGKDKRPNSNNGKPFLDDGGMDSSDTFSGGLFGEVNAKVFKKKKDVLKEADFHDPVRESFEAELERVQRMQEMERQRAMEEQNRALEFARREQEQRERLVREEEERRRRVEEEAREAAWRAEQEKMEAARRAEAQRVAREEEKRRIFMEEERRKEAARKKLLELEARMAKRHGEGNSKDDRPLSSVTDERLPMLAKEGDTQRATDIGEWEDGERMVEHITSTASSDSSSTRPHSSREGNSSFIDRGKHASNWRRDTYDNGNNTMFFSQDQDNDYHSQRRDMLTTTRGYPRKETHGNLGAPARPMSKGVTSEALQVSDDLRYPRHRWNIADGDYFNRNVDIDANFLDSDKFGDAVWGTGHSRGSPHSSYTERPYQNSEIDEFSTFGRSRHSLRQPRVLPPPSVSMRRSPFRAASEFPSSSSFLDTELSYQHSGKAEEASYDSAETLQPPATDALLTQSTVPAEQKADKNSMRCDSQSSLSVSSPPASPTQEDLDESEDFQTQPTSAVGESTAQSDNEHIPAPLEAGDSNILPPSSPLSHGEDDEWATENHEIQEQEEYDEDDDGYHEEEDGNTENLDPRHELEIIQSEDTSVEADQIVLGFDDGVQVNIPINDELEKDTGIDVVVQSSVDAGQEQIHSDKITEAENDSSTIITDTDKPHRDLGVHPVASTSTVEKGSSEMLSPAISSSTLVQPIFSSVATSSVQSVLSSVPTMAPQSEVPFQLQFGLFSGPSLFPSPVPAIQIGSIQMPLHLHPQVGPSVSHMHAPPPPLLQFGQLRYAPLAPQTVSFSQPSSAHHSLNKNVACSASLNHSTRSLVDKQHNVVTKPSNVSRNNIDRGPINALPILSRNDVACHNQTGGSSFVEVRSRYGSASQTDRRGIRDIAVKKNYRPMVNNMESEFHAEHNPSRSFLGEKPGNRGRRFAYAVRNVGSRTPFSGPDVSHTDSAGFQRRPRRNVRRTEFRVRENADKRHTEAVGQFYSAGHDGKPDFNASMHANTSRYGGKRDAGPSKLIQTVEPDNINSSASSSRVVIPDGKMDKVSRKDISSKKRLPTVHNLYAGEGNLKRNGISEDVDAPLQSNIVRVFNQPGIEVPSDEDDFIQVRSKRQMLNDRREQREKELKAMSRAVKAPRKTRAAPQSNAVQSKSNRAVSSTSGDRTENNRVGSGITDGRGFATVESSPMFTANVASQSLPPIGTPSPSVDSSSKSKNLKSSRTDAVPTVSSGGTKFVSDLSFEKNNSAFDIASVPLVSWGNVDINQQVMALTQSQLDEAMQPARSDSLTSLSITHEPVKLPTLIMTQEATFSSSLSPLNSLLAGQTIQFGAVTSPAILPPVSRVVPNGIGLPASGRPDIGMTPKLPNDCTVLFDKEKRPGESCANAKDPEAEAEAAASAVAVAAISNSDEIAGNRLSACSVSVSDTRNFNTSDAITLTSKGVSGSEEVTGQSAAEDSLAVSLPADLSVDTPSLPLWPPLPSPQSSSGPMLSHFPPPSHFPCFEMNPMLGAPIFAFGPQDESTGTQAQPQSTMGSGGWPQCHSAIDSFYGPPASYTGPFIGPPGGIPGVQGPPHMVVYNHFAPVGQFGQVGLSFMGTTYIPTGKQPDWKHNPVSSAAGVGESVVSGPRNPSGMPTIQHLAPGSPLMQMGSPLTMFDMPPFQSSADVSMQGRWSHIPIPPIHSLPLPVPLQQHQVEGMPTQFGRNPPGDNRFHDARVATASNANRSASAPQNSSLQFPNELGLVEPPSNTPIDNKASRPSGTSDNKGVNTSKSSARTMTNTGESGSNGNNRGQVMGSTPKATDHRGSGVSQKAASGGEWHRRTGYQGRNQPSGSDKSFPSSKVKQIYVPKSQTGNSVTG